MPNSYGRFVWHELSTSDPDGAQRFYTAIIPWGTQPWEDNPEYTLWTSEGTPIGGVEMLKSGSSSESAHPRWLPYVSVYDVDDCARQAKQLGAAVVKGPIETPNVGCWAIINDPQGAAIGLFEPVAPSSTNGEAPARGHFSWHELTTSDYRAAFDFYRALFKWETTGEFDMGEMGTYHMYGKGGQVFGGMMNRRPDMPPPNWMSYVRIDDVKLAAEKVASNGGSVIIPPMEVPGGDWITMCVDPQGAPFALHTLKTS